MLYRLPHTVMNHSILDEDTYGLSSVEAKSRESSWGTKFARSSDAMGARCLPARAQQERRRRSAARRPGTPLLERARASASLAAACRAGLQQRRSWRALPLAGGSSQRGSCDQRHRVQPLRLQQRGHGCSRTAEVFGMLGVAL